MVSTFIRRIVNAPMVLSIVCNSPVAWLCGIGMSMLTFLSEHPETGKEERTRTASNGCQCTFKVLNSLQQLVVFMYLQLQL